MIRLVATSRRARAHSDEPITTGSAGIPIALTLSEDFDGLAVTLVCEAGGMSRDLAVMGGVLVVPHELLTHAGDTLTLGVYAALPDGTIVIPTVWAVAGKVVQGTVPSETSPSDPTPSWAAQVQEWAEDAHDTAERLAEEVDGWETEIDAAVQGAENVDAVASKSGTTATITVTDREGVEHTVTVSDGAQGEAGRDGYSPSAKVLQGDGSATITITDKDGTTTATVYDGADGRDGRDGTDGADGYSPTATVTQTAMGATISITDRSGTTTASVSNGMDGTDGTDGFSPTVDVQPITGGHEVTITDAQGAHSFDVMDGDPAEPGSITDAMLAPDGIKAQVASMWGNQLVGTMSGTIDTAADAYAASPMALTVEGASTQDGTPTPDAPVPILSVDDLALVVAGKNLFDKDNATLLNAYFNSGGSIIGNAYNRIAVVKVEPSTTYALQFTQVKLGTSGDDTALWLFDAEPSIGVSGDRKATEWITTSVSGGNHREIAFTTDSTTRYIAFKLANVGNTDLAATLATTQLEIGSTATAYEPYQGTTVQLYDGTLRSLPDGTKDVLNLSYLRPSTRPGWAWCSRSVTAYTGSTTTAATDGITGTIGVDVMSTTGEIADGPTVVYKLATPVTTTLDPIELPELPAPNCTVFCDGGSAQPTYTMEYVQDTNIVIGELRAALADLATS